MPVPTNFVFYDGFFNTPTPTGAPIPIYHPPFVNLITESASHSPIAWKQQYYVRIDTGYSNTAPPYGDNTSAFGTSFYLVEETEPVDSGVGQVATFYRTYAKRPPNTSTQIVASKTYQWANYTFNGPNIIVNTIDTTVITWAKEINCTLYLDFYLNAFDALPMPGKPFIQALKLTGDIPRITDFGSGFPLHPNNPAIFGDNRAASFLSGSIEPYLGKMVVRKMVWG